MKLYKITREDFATHRGTLWGDGVTHSAADGEPRFCSATVIHAYECPRLAILMNPAHADYNPTVLWEAEGGVVISDGTKVGCKSLTTIRKISIEKPDLETIVGFGILCAAQVYKEENWLTWARAWLAKTDRSKKSADAAAAAADAAAAAAAVDDAAHAAAADAAAAAADAADAAAAAAAARAAAHAAYAAADASRAARAAHAAYAAYAAARAAHAARAAAVKIDFAALANRAFNKEFIDI